MDGNYDYGMWVAVALSIALFVFFILSFLAPQGRAEWRGFGVVTAFLVALFTEMFGFPLTIYLLTGWLGAAYPALEPFSHKYGHLWVVVLGGSSRAWALVMGVSLLLLAAGYVLLSKGWRRVHAAGGRLVTDGLYVYARHPQYTGLFLIVVSFLVQWPTLATALMAPVLIYAYVLLARSEERSLLQRFGQTYLEYARRTPRFFPSVSAWRAFLWSSVRQRTQT